MKQLELLFASSLLLAACGSSSGNGDAGVDRIILVDANGMPDAAMAACTTAPQGGCDAGTKCDVTNAMVQCDPDVGTFDAGVRCSLNSQCVKGTQCVNISAAGAICDPFCRDDQANFFSDCAGLGNGSGCFYVLINAAMMPIDGANICSVPCDPFLQTTGCPGTQICLFDDVNFQNPYGTCLPPAATLKAAGMPCMLFNECAAGLNCILDNTNTLKCHQLCDNTHACTTGTCTTFTIGTPTAGLGFCPMN